MEKEKTLEAISFISVSRYMKGLVYNLTFLHHSINFILRECLEYAYLPCHKPFQMLQSFQAQMFHDQFPSCK